MRDKHDESLSEVYASVDIKKTGWRKLFSFLGPAYLISVGYMDPGNWAADLAGGSKFGYSLIWVLLMSNIMAILLQGLSARLGIVRGRDLAQANKEAYPQYINFTLYLLAEGAIAACDLAEVLGMAIGIQLLTGLPLIWGVGITIFDTFLLLYLQRMGMRKMEAFIVALVATIAICFLIQLLLAHPDPKEIATGFVPSFASDEALYIAIAMIGATVMPHNLYLHSALVQTRKIERTEEGIRSAIRFNRIDSTIALNVAFLVNAGILILAATVFNKTGNAHVASIKEAHQLLPGFLGTTAPILFAVALIAAGQSSTITGTLAGQIVMEGYLSLRINPMLRRILTRVIAIVPALIIIGKYGENRVDAMLVLSQVILSLQLGFAIIPLIHFVSDKNKMGVFAIGPFIKLASWTIAAILIALNIRMLFNEVAPEFLQLSNTTQWTIIMGGAYLGFVLLYIIAHPLIARKDNGKESRMHPSSDVIETFHPPVYKKIAIALDFSGDDSKIISYAMSQGNKETEFLIIHIVESASASLFGNDSDDLETRKDKERMARYIQQLKENHIRAAGVIGFRDRKKEIIRLVTENEADMLVMGAHGHGKFMDFLYGETVNAVRHKLKIPVLVVNL